MTMTPATRLALSKICAAYLVGWALDQATSVAVKVGRAVEADRQQQLRAYDVHLCAMCSQVVEHPAEPAPADDQLHTHQHAETAGSD